MRTLLIFLLAIFAVSILLLWGIHTSLFFPKESALKNFFDVLLQSFLSASILGIVFEVLVWKISGDKIKKEFDKMHISLINLIKSDNQTLLSSIPMLLATSIEKINKLTPDDASNLVKRILEQNCKNKRVALAISKITSNVIALDDNETVSNLKHVIRVFKEEDIYRCTDIISYRTSKKIDSFSFGVFISNEEYEKYLEDVGEIDGYWISKKAFSHDGSYKGNLVYLSDFYITEDGGVKKKYEISALNNARYCIYKSMDIVISGNSVISYNINSFLSKKNPIIHISSPFIADTMTVRIACTIEEISNIIYKVAAPFSGNINVIVENKKNIEITINDVVFPGHGFMFSLRRH